MPLLSTLANALGTTATNVRTMIDAGILAKWAFKDEKGQIQVNKQTLRQDFPQSTLEAWHQSVYSRLERMVPENLRPTWVGFVNQLTDDQQADLHQSAADAATDKENKEQKELQEGVVWHFIESITTCDTFEAWKQYFDRLNWIKTDPSNYGVGQVMKKIQLFLGIPQLDAAAAVSNQRLDDYCQALRGRIQTRHARRRNLGDRIKSAFSLRLFAPKD